MDRRQFLQSSAAFSTLPALPFSISVADAAGGVTPNANESGYKALVCVFLFGGNDSHNTVVPYQGAEYNAYRTLRGGEAANSGLALPQSSLDVASQRLKTTGLALHPAMTRLGALYAANKLAVVANCGPLLDETTLANYNNPSHPLPPQLFSHSDMQTHWQTMIPDQPADTGWAGRMSDAFRIASAGRLPVGIAVGGGGVFMKGDLTVPYSVTPMRYKNGTIDLASPVVRVPKAAIDWNWTAVEPDNPNSINRYPQDVFQNNYMAARANLLEQQYAKTVRGSLEVGEFVRDAMYNITDVPNVGTQYTLKTAVPGAWPTTNPLAAQLHSVAAMIAARSALTTTRQIFFVSLGGFDNHGDQFGGSGATRSLLSGKHFTLLNYLDEALATFYNATVSLGVADNVTTMTMSDFGRTMHSNGAGSDHGWGGHYFVLGGKVKGGKILGAQSAGAADSNYFPMPSQLGSVDVGEGRLLPTLSSDAYAATLASWFGADSGEIAQIFPNLSRFYVPSLDLMNP